MGDIFVEIGKDIGKVFAGAARLWIWLIFGKRLHEIHGGAKVGAVFLSILPTGLLIFSPVIGIALFSGLFGPNPPSALRIALCAGFAAAVVLFILWVVVRKRKEKAAAPSGKDQSP